MSGIIGTIQQLETANVPDPDIWTKSLTSIGNSNIDQTYDLSANTTHAHGVYFKDDGAKMLVGSMSGGFNDYVIEYVLGTGWQLSSGVTVSSTASDHLDTNISGGQPESLIGGIAVAGGGTKIYTFGRTSSGSGTYSNGHVDRFDLSTAWDLGSGSFATSNSTNFLDTSSQISNVYDGYVKDDGTEVYVVGYGPDNVYQYTLSTAHDLSTASLTNTFDISAKSPVTSGLHFSSDGYAFVVYDNTSDAAHKYNLTTAWDVSTASFDSSTGSFSSSETTGGGIWFDDDWSYLYLVGENSDTAHRVALAAIPGAPTSLSISTASASQLDLSWSAPSSGADSYKIYRSTSSGGSLTTVATGITATSYSNTGLSTGTRYYYKVKATNSEGDSGYSSEASRFTTPATPMTLTASDQSNTQIDLGWASPLATPTGYYIERSTSSGSGFSQIANIIGSATTYSSTGLTQNTTYYYRIRAYTDPGATSAYSSEASDTTQNNASAPTSVSIATSSSGNYNNSVIIVSKNLGSSGEDALTSNDGSTASSNTVTIEFQYSIEYNQMLLNNSGQLRFHTKSYGRATNGTSYAFDISNISAIDSASALASTGYVGSPITAQDGTGSSGVGEDVVFNHNSGGRGYLLLTYGDKMLWEVDFDATNSGGTTSATTIDVELEIT